jgi:IclR family pca regulon transcriptional regulator
MDSGEHIPDVKPRDAEQMGGFAKGLAVIEAFARGRNGLTIADVARLTGLDRATARRCLLTLVKTGYAASDGRQFELTPRILRLGHAYLAASLPRLIQPSLDGLAEALHESCSAAVLDGSDVIYIARTSRHPLMGGGLHPGSRLPAYCTAMGRVLLAARPPEQRQSLLQASDRVPFTQRTLTDVDDLMGELERVREQGYAIIDQELEMGARAIAAPVRNVSGSTVAAINVAAHVADAPMDRLRGEILPRLLEAQATLAEILP